MKIDGKLKECLLNDCNSFKLKVSCAKAGDPGCDGDPCAYNPGLYGEYDKHIVICPSQFGGACSGSMCTTLLHEMVHACGELGKPTPLLPEP